MTARTANRRLTEMQSRILRLEAELARLDPARTGEAAAFAAQPLPAPAFEAPTPAEPDLADRGPLDVAGEELQSAPQILEHGETKPQESLETRIGARWSVLIGGLISSAQRRVRKRSTAYPRAARIEPAVRICACRKAAAHDD